MNSSHLTHLAIIMDGNGRWAKKNGTSRALGYKKGGEIAKKIVQRCSDLNIEFLTLYTFSSENWNRPLAEINDIMCLLKDYLNDYLESVTKNNVKINFIGSRDRLSPKIQELMHKTEKRSVDNTGLYLTIALDYGSRQEIRLAAKEMVIWHIENNIPKSEIAKHPYANFDYFINKNNIPDPDLLIRTSGEKRLSNFLLWQSCYTELYFTDVLWPDFTAEDLDIALADYTKRERRFGSI